MKKRTIFTSVLTILLCLSVIAGSTFALLSSKAVFNIAIGSGKVKMTAVLQNLKLYSMEREQQTNFENGGTAFIDGGLLNIQRMTPGDKVTAEIAVTNSSNVGLKYRVVMKADGELGSALDSRVTIDGKVYKISNTENRTPWIWVPAGKQIPTDGKPIGISILLPTSVTDQFQNAHSAIAITVEAVQGNAEMWDGTTDTGWYESAPNASTYEIKTAQELAGIAKLLRTNAASFNGKTVKLMNDIELAGFDWTPIVINSDRRAISLTVDGNGRSINGLTVSAAEKGGFFGSSNANITVKNLTFKNAQVTVDGDVAGVLFGYQSGNAVLENVDVLDSTVATNGANGTAIGGLIGFSAQNNGATLKMTGCDVKEALIIGYHAVGTLVGKTATVDTARMEVNGCVAQATLIYSDKQSVGAHQWASGVDGYTAAGFVGNNNTAGSTVQQRADNTLYTAKDLFELAARVNGGESMEGKTWTLANDIDLNGKSWTPIGTAKNPFKGIFDGQGHTVSNLDVNCSENGGFFGAIRAGVVKKLTLDNVSIYSEFTAGAVAGNVYGDIVDCTVKNARIVCFDLNPDAEMGRGDNVGALVGYIADEGVGSEVYGNKVVDCFVSGNRDLGMLIGYAADGVKISGNQAENVQVVCNGYTKSNGSLIDLRIGGMVGNRID